jgi:hypothetical protein
MEDRPHIGAGFTLNLAPFLWTVVGARKNLYFRYLMGSR